MASQEKLIQDEFRLGVRFLYISSLVLAGDLAGVSPPAAANQRFIVRTTSLPMLQNACVLNLYNLVQALDGKIGQIFLVEFPSVLPVNTLINILRIIPGVLDAEVDVLQNLALNPVPATGVPTRLNDRNPVQYYGTTVWDGYATQPAVGEIQLPEARAWFRVAGAAIVAHIDSGVGPNHPVLASSLLAGYDFTRNQVGGSEMTDVPSEPESDCSQCAVATVNKSSVVVMRAST